MQWQVENLEIADSTNDVARERVLALWGRGHGATGLVITAQQQTGGRGQHGRRWESPRGGLYLSAIVENIPPSVRGKLALVAGVAVAEAIAEIGLDAVRLRWPNDLMIGDKKVGGILCEAVAMGEHQWAGIIGIGINVVTKIEQFPAALRGQVISLTSAALATLPSAPGFARGQIDAALKAVLGHLGRNIEKFQATSHATNAPLRDILDRVRELDALRGRQVTVEVGEEEISGTAAGIGDQGELLIRRGDELRVVEVGTVISVDGTRVRR